jgi:uridine kinase
MNYADLIVPGNRDNKIAVDLLIHELKTQAKQIWQYREVVKKDAVFVGDVIDPNLI